MLQVYPPFGLSIRTPTLELRGATDDLLMQLLPIVSEGTYDPAGPAPYDDPMSFYLDSPERETRWIQAIWASRSQHNPQNLWRLNLVVIVEGRPVGIQDLIGVRFGELGSVTTFSWLGRSFQGRGLGKEMRHAVLHLAFAGLGARRAQSEAFCDNHASIAVSRALGYQPNGTSWETRRGEPGELLRLQLTREEWDRRRRSDIELTGVNEVRRFLRIKPAEEDVSGWDG